MAAEEAQPVIVCDTSPLIFLAKVNHLGLIQALFPGRCVVLECVAAEVLHPGGDPLEQRRLAQWFDTVERPDYEGSLFESAALSRSDQASLAWAVRNRADLLIADERLLRRFAREHHIAVVGFCGIIIKAARIGHLNPQAAREIIDESIARHGLRLSIRVYQAIMQRLPGQ